MDFRLLFKKRLNVVKGGGRIVCRKISKVPKKERKGELKIKGKHK
jgi:hypothetical protein